MTQSRGGVVNLKVLGNLMKIIMQKERPQTIITQENVEKVRDLVLRDRRDYQANN